jgi:hypothetical protein
MKRHFKQLLELIGDLPDYMAVTKSVVRDYRQAYYLAYPANRHTRANANIKPYLS